MNAVNIIFPNQLFEHHPFIGNGAENILVEEYLFFRHYEFHKRKIAFHRETMKKYERYLISQKLKVKYVSSNDTLSDIRKLIPYLNSKGVEKIHIIDPVDDWLMIRTRKAASESGLDLEVGESPMFLNTNDDLYPFFRKEKKKFFQTSFYIEQRKKRNILVDNESNPLGGKWSFDKENRKKYPRKKNPPNIYFPKKDSFSNEAEKYVSENFEKAPGELEDSIVYPSDFRQAESWLSQFFEYRFFEFGDYEDAMVQQECILHHSVLTPMLNIGLITPQKVLDMTLEFGEKENVPMNSLEGFVRQIVGWREFIRGIYVVKGGEERTKNFWNFKRKIPVSFYRADTGVLPVDTVINKVMKTGYCHHIERLMVLGNFMLLCEFDPDEVYRWFMELFIDAYDWVMVPNVYGMSQFADGGLMSTKPYISGSNYLKKMSDFPKGDWEETWDALFWRFMHVHRSFFLKNPRLGMLVRNFDKMNAEKQQRLLNKADGFLKSLDE